MMSTVREVSVSTGFFCISFGIRIDDWQLGDSKPEIISCCEMQTV